MFMPEVAWVGCIEAISRSGTKRGMSPAAKPACNVSVRGGLFQRSAAGNTPRKREEGIAHRTRVDQAASATSVAMLLRAAFSAVTLCSSLTATPSARTNSIAEMPMKPNAARRYGSWKSIAAPAVSLP